MTQKSQCASPNKINQNAETIITIPIHAYIFTQLHEQFTLKGQASSIPEIRKIQKSGYFGKSRPVPVQVQL